MRIAVLSDTHLKIPSSRLTEEYEAELRHMDAVLHCGDFTGEPVWAYLNGHPAFYAVSGNMDADFGGGFLPDKRLLELSGFRVGMLHGDGLGLGSGDPVQRMLDFWETELALFCYGHTHRRELRRSGSTTVLNPGSFRLPKGDSKAGYAVIDLIPDQGIQVEWREVQG